MDRISEQYDLVMAQTIQNSIGWSCEEVAAAFFCLTTTRSASGTSYLSDAIAGLTSFEVGGSAGFLSAVQEEGLKAFVATTLPVLSAAPRSA
jgi:hypothetical protein